MTLLRRIAVVAACVAALLGLVRTDAGASATSVPFRFIDNRVFVSCFVDGKGPYAFIVDTGTGAEVVVSTALARALKLPLRAAGTTSGAGSRQAALSRTELSTFDLGGIRLRGVRAAAIDLGEIKRGIGFARFDGIVGYAVFRRYRMKVDIDVSRLTLDTSPLAVPAQARSVPFTLEAGLIHVPASLDGVPGSVVVDTGDRSSLTIFRPFANAHGVYRRYPARRDVLTGYGVGGPVYSDVFTLPRFGIFGWTVRGVVTRASRDRGGVFATASEAGSIGGGILRRFNVVYDYPAQRMIVWPSRDFSVTDRYVPPRGSRR
jgi:predicted aspartyl protease